jgi:hypothetical protein
VSDGVLLAGDAAGLAYPESGEGIRPAIESGLLAAAVIRQNLGSYSEPALDEYRRTLLARFGDGPQLLQRLGSAGQKTAAIAAKYLLRAPWFVRHVVLDRWFLHAQVAPLAV